jgi:hypothetical protein
MAWTPKMEKKNRESAGDVTLVDLFAGTGSFALAGRALGIHDHRAMDLSRDKCQLYARNFSHPSCSRPRLSMFGCGTNLRVQSWPWQRDQIVNPSRRPAQCGRGQRKLTLRDRKLIDHSYDDDPGLVWTADEDILLNKAYYPNHSYSRLVSEDDQTPTLLRSYGAAHLSDAMVATKVLYA